MMPSSNQPASSNSGPAIARLRPGVRLVLGPGVNDGPTRIALSQGTEEASGRTLRGQTYRTPSFVPRLPWVRPNADEMDMLTRGSSHDDTATSFVAVVKISERSLADIHALGFGRQMSRESYDQLASRELTISALKSCFADLAPYIDRGCQLKALGFAIGEPGIPTVATDPLRRAGLHVDNWDDDWDGTTLRNRLHLNLGCESRHFLFINVLVQDFPVGPEIPAGPGVGTPSTRLGHAFMRGSPEYSVVRVRIDPGEAYLAPTDYLIHDGDSTGKTLPDVNFAMLGRWRCPAEISAR
jgi:hypothetical protein